MFKVRGSGDVFSPDVRTKITGVVEELRTQPHVVSITNATEYGCVYTPAEVAALGAMAKERGWRFHMDGARFANAGVTLGCTPAQLTCGKRYAAQCSVVTRSLFQAGTEKYRSGTGTGTISTRVLMPERSSVSAVKALSTRIKASLPAMATQSGRGE